MKKASNPESKYFLKKWQERFPGDTQSNLARRININKATLHNIFFEREDPFFSAKLLMRLCSYIGISMESVVLKQEIKYDKNPELNYWKERTFKAEAEAKNLKSVIHSIKEIANSKQSSIHPTITIK